MRARLRLGSVAALVFVSSTVMAEEPTDEPVEALKARGHQAMMNMNYAEALAAYRSALAKNPNDTSLLYNIGRAHQAREEYPEALDVLGEFELKAPPEVRAKVPALADLVADVRSRVGSLTIRCTKAMVQGVVLVGERTRLEGCGPAPKLVRVSLPTKSARLAINVESNELQATTKTVELEGGKAPIDVVLDLAEKATSGLLRVRTTPASAVLSVDAQPHGNSPLEIQLGVGAHVIDIRAEGYESARIPVVIAPGATKDVVYTLEKIPPITRRWWFWVGVGVGIVTIATVTTILVAQPEREPSRGSIDPGVIQTPLVSF